MTNRFELNLLPLCGLLVLAPGCPLTIDNLDVGIDESGDDGDGEPLECLVGTTNDAVGTEQSSDQTDCEVTCATGWGHDAAQLPIAWTAHMVSPWPGDVFDARALGRVAGDRLAVGVQTGDSFDVLFFALDGSALGGFDAPNIRSVVYRVEFSDDRAYIAHGDEDGVVAISAIDLESQQQLWITELSGMQAWGMAVGPANVALTLTTTQGSADTDLVMLDLDGAVQWTAPSLETSQFVAFSLVFSPSGERVVASGPGMRVFATADGQVIQDIIPEEDGPFYSNAVFIDDDQLVSAGSVFDFHGSPAWFGGTTLDEGQVWTHLYQRATAWCPTGSEDPRPSTWISGLAQVDDTVVAVGDERVSDVSNPWVALVSADGEFLASDRPLWPGGGIDVVAGPDNSAFVLLTETAPGQDAGFYLRKYTP